MQQWLKTLWQDSVWSKVIAGIILASLGAIWGSRTRWFGLQGSSILRKTHAYPSDQSVKGASYPLKYYVELINDSKKCVEVRVGSFSPDMITLQKLVFGSLQIMLGGQWLPTPDSIDCVALLPNQRCRIWIAADSNKFSTADLEHSVGRIGTLTLRANSKHVDIKL